MEKILFLAPYPNEENIKDGYIQRIKNIDNLFLNCKRCYLLISLKTNIKDEEYNDNNVDVLKLNLFRNFKKIKNIISGYNKIYIHSIYRYFPACLFFTNNQEITLDFHGIVPEELSFSGNKFKSLFYQKIEKDAFKRINNVICVTYSMIDFLKKKYKKANNVHYFYYPIIAKNTLINSTTDNIKKEENEIVFVYSGNCQKWQRIQDIVKFMNNHDNKSYTYYFLTLNQNEMRSIITKTLKKDFKSKIIYDTVNPSELHKYYNIADYGFLIRDDHPLNRVANPTKML